MKYSLLAILVIPALSLTLTNCSKETIKGCTDPSATNYNPKAEENDGSCVYNPCSGITCLNGGTCIDGLCSCPQGYTGSNCQTQVTPSYVTVSKITVTSFCEVCDPDETYPDIFVKLINNSNSLYTSPYFEDATSSLYYEFIPATSIQLNPIANFTMEMWDYDPLVDDLIHTVNFNIYSSTGGFPSSITITSNPFSFKLDLTYSF